MDGERADRIAGILLRRFSGNEGRVDDLVLDPEERAELHLLDGRLISHEVGKRVGPKPAPHFWIFAEAHLPGELDREGDDLGR